MLVDASGLSLLFHARADGSVVRPAGRQTSRPVGRKTGMQADRHADKQTSRQIDTRAKRRDTNNTKKLANVMQHAISPSTLLH
jgi:hypothetical protein